MKKIYFYLDIESIPDEWKIPLWKTYDGTKEAIDNNYDEIHTTSLANISFDLINQGYEIHVVKNKKDIIMKPGMNSKGNKDIRIEHNLERLIKGGYFDEDFKGQREIDFEDCYSIFKELIDEYLEEENATEKYIITLEQLKKHLN